MVKMETEIKCEMLYDGDIKTEIFDGLAAEHDIYDLKVEEYCPMNFETSIKIEDVTNSRDSADSYNSIDIKSHQDESAADHETLNLKTEHKKTKSGEKIRKSTDSTANSRCKRKRRHNEDIIFTCGFCAQTFAKSKDFFSHMESHSEVKNNNEENKCEENTSKTEITLTSKVVTDSKKKITKPLNVIFQCDQCTQTFTLKTNLKRHKLLHTKTRKKPVCDMCKKRYNNKTYLIQHIKTLHLKGKSDTVFVCNVCEKTVNTAYALRCHMQIHTGCKPFVCTICMKGFSNKWNLKVHLKSH